MQDNGFVNIWVGSDISWCNPWIVCNESMPVPSGGLMSSGHHNLDLALKLPNIILQDGLSCLMVSEFIKFNCWLTWRSVDNSDITFLTLKGYFT